jgi:hypothetical protein
MKWHQGLIVKKTMGTVPEQEEARLIAKRMREREGEYFRFIAERIDATNIPAKLTIQQSILDRIITQAAVGQQATDDMSVFGQCIRLATYRILR